MDKEEFPTNVIQLDFDRDDSPEEYYDVFLKLYWCPPELQGRYPLSMTSEELDKTACEDIKRYIDKNVGFTEARPKAMEITEYGEYIVDCYEY